MKTRNHLLVYYESTEESIEDRENRQITINQINISYITLTLLFTTRLSKNQ